MPIYQAVKSAGNLAYNYLTGNASAPASAEQGNAETLEALQPAAAGPEATPTLDRAAASGAGPEFNDGGGYSWRADGNGGYVCVGAPAGTARAIGFVVTSASAPDSYALLASLDPSGSAGPSGETAGHQAPETAEQAPPAPDKAEALDMLPGWEDMANALAGGAEQAAGALWQATQSAAEVAVSPIDALRGWWSADLDHQAPAGGGAPPGHESPSPSPQAPAATGRQETAAQQLADGKSNPLDAAIDLADELTMQHGYDGAVNDDLQGVKRREEILEGNVDDLKTILCSEFTAAVLERAGYDLTDHFRDPATGHFVAYADGTRPDGSPKLRVVDCYMIVNAQPEATRAVLDAASGQGEVIDPASARAGEVGGENLPDTFIYTTETTFVGMDASTADEFGAGAVAVQLGGLEVEPADRKPGDLNQTLNTQNGSYVGSGHSSTIYSVKGTGIALLGSTGSPKLEGSTDLPPGWYEVVAGSKLRWVIEPDTDPATVASFSADHVQLIDANQRGAGNDATAVGDWSKEREFKEKGWSKVTSSGRLPTSKWFGWTPSSPSETVEVLT